tara:strand:- start:210 stop:2135 length:1926 start_codon:yes stop_codon:yes gene_type:complete
MAINKVSQEAFSNIDMVMNTYTATAGQTAFTLSKSSTTNAVIVHVNDVIQQPTTDYSVSGTTLTLASGAAVGDDVRVRTLSENPLGVAASAFTTANARSSISVTTGSASGGGALSYDSGTGVLTFNPGTSNTAANLRTAVSVGSEGTAAGDGSLAYNNSTGVFTYTPPSLAGLIGGSPSSNQVIAWNGSAWAITNVTWPLTLTGMTINRSGDGDLIAFQKGGVDSGSISIESSGTSFDGEGSHAGLKMFASSVSPRQNGADIDATIDLGWTGGQFKDLHLSGTVFATSATFDDDIIVGQGLASSLMSYDSASTKLTVYDNTGSAQSGYLELGATATTNGYNAGAIQFINNDNSDATTTDTAGSKCVSQIRSVIKTSDSNAGDDSGGTLQFWTKQEGEKLHNTARLEHPNAYHRIDMVVTAEDLPGDGGANANSFFTAKAKGNYYTGLNLTSTSGHIGGWLGHWNGGSTSRELQARVGGTGLNASDTLSFHIDHQGCIYYDAHPTDGGTSANAILQPANGKFERSTASSRKLKENIKDIELDCSKIHDLKVRQFDYKSNYVTNPDAAARKDIGLIAEETHEVEPTWAVMGYVDEATCTFKTDDNIPAGESKHAMDIHWRRLQVAMLKEIQRLNDRITALENA